MEPLVGLQQSVRGLRALLHFGNHEAFGKYSVRRANPYENDLEKAVYLEQKGAA